MNKEICVLLDMDGVVLDTETQYDTIWKHMGDKYDVGISNFEKVIKGTTLPNIIKKYFSGLSEQEQNSIVKAIDDFEANMDFMQSIPGSLDFVHALKSAGVKVGLVTSSTLAKMNVVNKAQHFETVFDTVVYAERITHSKPNPECYLLAAKDLGVKPENCIVFEDSFAGIEAGKAAGMTVIALATTHPADKLRDKADTIIPDFRNFDLTDIEAIMK